MKKYQTTHYVHCRLMSGGAANVLTQLIRDHGHSDETKIFTLFSPFRSRDVDGVSIPVHCAIPRRLQSVFLFFQKVRVPVLSWLFDYRNVMVIYPQLIALLRRQIQKQSADHLVISSFAMAKNITPVTKRYFDPVPGKCQTNKSSAQDDNLSTMGDDVRRCETTLYLHSPMQYIHTHRDEYSAKITGVKGWIFRSIATTLRKRDTLPRTYDTVIANSQYTADSAKTIYGLTANHVQYPPIDERFGQDAPIRRPDNYFVYVGRLVRFVKEIDKLIELVNHTGDNLILIGAGPDEAYLKSIAGPTCLFVGWIDDTDERLDIIRKSRGLLNITKESFGIATVEALLCGVPVFGYDDGASPELVDSNSGILVPDKETSTLIAEFARFKNKRREKSTIQKTIKQTLNSGAMSNQ